MPSERCRRTQRTTGTVGSHVYLESTGQNTTDKPTKHGLRDTESKWAIVRWQGIGGWVDQAKGLSSANGQFKNSHGDVGCREENTVNTVAIIRDSASGELL